VKNLKITLEDLKAEAQRRKYNKLQTFFPDAGKFSRDKYPKHIDIMAAGADWRERCFMAANRVGKSETGAFETACHLTGEYPSWWVGRRFHKAVSVIAAGETGKLVRDSMQFKLMGSISDIGTGFIPKDAITEKKPKSGIPDAFDMVYIKHKSGGTSVLQFQSYDQGREAFQATERDFIWFDEEPPQDVYSEALIRTMTTKGCVLTTFTPLKGVSETVLSLQDKAEKGAAYVIIATWDDAPHLDEQTKAEMLAALPPHQRDARSKGVPALGSGSVFQILEADITCPAFDLPEHFKRLYGLDVGWNNTAAAWGAYDPETDTIYLTHTYKRGQAEPAVHAQAIKQRGEWIPGAIDPASRGRAQKDGEQLIQLYREQGLDLIEADNAVEAGIFDMYERMSTGRFKVFANCTEFFGEYRLYRRDEKGKIVKQNDHVMDASRYMVREIALRGKQNLNKKPVSFKLSTSHRQSYMGV